MRPLTTYFDSLFTTSSYGGLSLYTSVYLIPKYGSFKNQHFSGNIPLRLRLYQLFVQFLQ